MSEPPRSSRSPADPNGGRPARCTVQGLGPWGARVASTLRSAGHDVALVTTGGADQRSRASARFSTPVMADVSAAVDAGYGDGVFVCTPGLRHADDVTAALALGVDVFVEKPMTVSPITARALVDAVLRAGRRVFVDHTWLYSEAFLAVAALVRTDPVTGLQATWIRPVPPSHSLVWELLPHPVSIALALMGPSAVIGADGTADAFDVTLRSKGGGRAELSVCRGEAQPVELTIRLASGRTIEWCDRRATLPADRLVLAVGEDDPLGAAISTFLAGEDTERSGAQFGAAVVDLVDAAERAASSPHRIRSRVG